MIKKRLYLIIIAAVCLLIVGLFTYRYFNQPSPTKTSVISTTTELLTTAQLESDVVNYSQAQDKKDLDPCLLIIDKQSRNFCIQELAMTTKDISICPVISSEEARADCSSSVLLEKAVTSQSLVDCQKIDSVMMKRSCIERIVNNDIKSDCNLILDQDLKNSCLSIIYYQQAKSENNYKTCNQIPELIQRANCLSELEKIDLHSDADKDGLDFLQEILSNTDPNNKDTDGDGHLDGEEVANGFNPDGAGSLPQPAPANLLNCQDIKDEEVKAICALELKDKPLNLLTCNDLKEVKLKDYCLKAASLLIIN